MITEIELLTPEPIWIMLVQITRSLKESHKHIPDAVLLVALGFVFQIIDCNKGSPLYFTGLLVYFKKSALVAKSNPCESKPDFFLR